MRSLLVLFTCVLLVILIVFVVVNMPTQSNNNIVVKPIELERQPQPVLQSDPVSDHILDFFPEPTESLPLQVPPEITDAPEIAVEPPQTAESEAPVINSEEVDKHNLLAHINDWVYETYSQVGQTKVGQIRNTRENVLMKVSEGMIFDVGIEVVQLTAEKVLLKLGAATFPLRRAEEPSFFQDLIENPRALTPEEQTQAYQYYMTKWGDKFKEYSKGYKPPVGMNNPGPITAEQREKAQAEYAKRYQQKFQRDGKTYQMPQINPQTQREMYKRYWEKHHPDREMPNFDEVFKTTVSGEGARVQE